ncbi:MAG: hypothetical protein QF898_01095 [SAR202 cluster bacterium]|jgi:hypothetical protein|nr:hypothetical protein [SAR202 cluster bacterium]MDP6513387.1 hypothetical protein [SAR202 cluster bacterium]
MLSTEYMFAIGLRGGLAIIFGLLFGIAGLVITFWVIPGLYTPPMWLLVFPIGVSSSFAVFLAYFKPETPWRILAIGLLIAVAGGLIGGWFGFFYAKIAYPDGVRNVLLVSRSVRSPAIMPFITFATIFSTILGGLYYGFRAWRYHEV